MRNKQEKLKKRQKAPVIAAIHGSCAQISRCRAKRRRKPWCNNVCQRSDGCRGGFPRCWINGFSPVEKGYRADAARGLTFWSDWGILLCSLVVALSHRSLRCWKQPQYRQAWEKTAQVGTGNWSGSNTYQSSFADAFCPGRGRFFGENLQIGDRGVYPAQSAAAGTPWSTSLFAGASSPPPFFGAVILLFLLSHYPARYLGPCWLITIATYRYDPGMLVPQ